MIYPMSWKITNLPSDTLPPSAISVNLWGQLPTDCVDVIKSVIMAIHSSAVTFLLVLIACTHFVISRHIVIPTCHLDIGRLGTAARRSAQNENELQIREI